MTSIVVSLQAEALNQESKVSDLLRKALVITRKLDQEEFGGWLDLELNGYGDTSPVPGFRKILGEVMVQDPAKQWQVISFQDKKLKDFLTHRNLSMSVPAIEKILESRTAGSVIGIPFPEDVKQRLMSATGAQSDPALIVPYSSFTEILAGVRTIILNWALDLEEHGILGEDLQFSSEEKERSSSYRFPVKALFSAGTYSAKEPIATEADIEHPENVSENPILRDIWLTFEKFDGSLPRLSEIEGHLKALEDALSGDDKSKQVEQTIGELRRGIRGGGDDHEARVNSQLARATREAESRDHKCMADFLRLYHLRNFLAFHSNDIYSLFWKKFLFMRW
jgi:hypothetical protein